MRESAPTFFFFFLFFRKKRKLRCFYATYLCFIYGELLMVKIALTIALSNPNSLLYSIVGVVAVNLLLLLLLLLLPLLLFFLLFVERLDVLPLL